MGRATLRRLRWAGGAVLPLLVATRDRHRPDQRVLHRGGRDPVRG